MFNEADDESIPGDSWMLGDTETPSKRRKVDSNNIVRIRCSEQFKRDLDWAVLFYEVENGRKMTREAFLEHLLEKHTSDRQRSVMRSCEPSAQALQKVLRDLHVHTPVRETKRKLLKRLLSYYDTIDRCADLGIDVEKLDLKAGDCVVMEAEKVLTRAARKEPDALDLSSSGLLSREEIDSILKKGVCD